MLKNKYILPALILGIMFFSYLNVTVNPYQVAYYDAKYSAISIGGIVDAIGGFFGGLFGGGGDNSGGGGGNSGGGWVSGYGKSKGYSSSDFENLGIFGTGAIVGTDSQGRAVVDLGGGRLGYETPGSGGQGDRNYPPLPPVEPGTYVERVACKSPANICGKSSTGYKWVTRRKSDNSIVSSTQCSATTPDVPDYVGKPCSVSVTNTCNLSDTAYGIISCANTCDITAYPNVVNDPVCLPTPPEPPAECPAGYTGTAPNCQPVECPAGTTGTPNNCVDIKTEPGALTADIKSRFNIVKQGGSVYISWTSTNARTCSVESDSNDDVWDTKTSNWTLTSPLDTETTYTITCIGKRGKVATDSVTIKVVPSFREI